MKHSINCTFVLTAFAAAMILTGCWQRNAQENPAQTKQHSSDDQPVTISGGSVKLETSRKDSWYDGDIGGNQLLMYNPSNGASAKLGQVEIKGTDSSGKPFNYLAFRDPKSDLKIVLEYSFKRKQDPITIVRIESLKSNSSAKRDALYLITSGTNKHRFNGKTDLLLEIEETGWQIQQVKLSGLILINVPGQATPPTEIDVQHAGFSIRLHHCTLDASSTDGRCAP